MLQINRAVDLGVWVKFGSGRVESSRTDVGLDQVRVNIHLFRGGLKSRRVMMGRIEIRSDHDRFRRVNSDTNQIRVGCRSSPVTIVGSIRLRVAIRSGLD